MMNSKISACFAALILGSVLLRPRPCSALTLEETYVAAGRLAFPKAPPKGLPEIFGPGWKSMLDDLTRPIDECLRRYDTGSPIFHGCVDWHSSVHAVGALLAYTNLTGDRRYAGEIEAMLAPEKLRREIQELRESPSFEMPYGRAWFLKLYAEYRKTFGKSPKELDELAALAAKSIMDFYGEHAPDFASDEYASASWALANLWDYAAATGNAEMKAFIRGKVDEHFFPKPGPREAGFFEPKLMDCLLLSKSLDAAAFQAWASREKDKLDLMLEPITPADAHEAGLNFSRAWGVWSLYEATGDSKYLDAYRGLVLWHYRHPEYWRDNYWAHAHWVPQFGVFAAARAAEGR